MQLGHAERLFAEVDARHLGTPHGHGLGQDAAAAPDVEHVLSLMPPVTRSIQSRRSGLISCNGRNSLSGSHQRCASAPNLATSPGSTLPMAAETVRSNSCSFPVGDQASCAATRARVPASAASSIVVRPAVRYHAFPTHPYIGDALATGRIGNV
jgi:hypothetical protein